VTIWQKMTDLGLQERSGQALCRSEVAYMLNDSFYCGIAHSKKYGRYPHRYLPLTKKEIWEACQDILSGRRGLRKPRSRAYVLKGLIVCQTCGCLYSPETHKGFVYYSCTNAKGICTRVYAREEVLLSPIHVILAAFEKLPQDAQDQVVSGLREDAANETLFREHEATRRRSEYERLEKRKNALLDPSTVGWSSQNTK
jgi:site-specific DNA recombinase